MTDSILYLVQVELYEQLLTMDADYFLMKDHKSVKSSLEWFNHCGEPNTGSIATFYHEFGDVVSSANTLYKCGSRLIHESKYAE